MEKGGCCKDVVPKGCQEVACNPNKEVAVCPCKEVAVCPCKDVVLVPNKDPKTIATIPGHEIKITARADIDIEHLPKSVRAYIEDKARICQPDVIYICDGTEEENKELLKVLEQGGWIQKLEKNNWLALTDPQDVARVESRTVISTSKQIETIPTPTHGFKEGDPSTNLRGIKCSALGNWMSLDDFQYELDRRLPGCMKGRTMYVIPYSMGPVGGSISKVGIELTDSPYVVCSMRIMTRMGVRVLSTIKDEDIFVKCLHTVGVPLPTTRKIVNNWPCNPEMTMIGHLPEKNEVISFGSGYGGNSLLGKKCFALRLGSIIAKREGWLAEHMLILGMYFLMLFIQYFILI